MKPPWNHFLAVAAAFWASFACQGADAGHFHVRFPRQASFHLAATSTPDAARFLRAWPDDGSTNWIDFSERLVVQTRDASQIAGIVASTGLKVARKITERIVILDAGSPANALRLADRLADTPGVVSSYPVFRDTATAHGPYYKYPSDMGFGMEWYLENRNADGSQAGPDMNVRAAWPYTMGQGVTVGVVDSGIELTHQELSNNVAGAPHFNFVLDNTNGAPVNRFADGAHGTEVAGLLGAEANNFRMVGVAPAVQLASMVIYDSNTFIATDEQRMDAYQYDSNVVQVQNHSWGLSPAYTGQAGPTLLEGIGLTNAFENGREGKGTIMVRSAGDGRSIQQDANDSGYASDPHVIAVAAIDQNGRVASYSDFGACVLVAAPSGDPSAGFTPLFTTDLNGTDGVNQINFLQPDLNDYVFSGLGFYGTSASAPQISGVVALMLSANSNLTWRDVQAILALSSRHFDFADPDVTTNGAGFVVSHNLGFGVPDAGVAVHLARLWTNLPSATNITVSSSEAQIIPPGGLDVVLTDGLGNPIYNAVALPDLGKQVDDPTPLLPLVNCGTATNPITLNLTNKGALIERGGTNSFAQKLQFAANAGAAFAVVYNFPPNLNSNQAPGGDVLFPMGGTDRALIPAVFIGNTDGNALLSLGNTYTNATAQIDLDSATYTFTITNSLACEHVALRIQASNLIRGNLRITLTSPAGTRSVLGRYSADTNSGPADWTYYTTHCLFENSAGVWTAAITDEGQGDSGSLNTVNAVSLTVTGTPYSIAGRNKAAILESYLSHQGNVVANLSPWNATLARVSWNTVPGAAYDIFSGTNVANLSFVTNVSGRFPTAEWFPPFGSNGNQFFSIYSNTVGGNP